MYWALGRTARLNYAWYEAWLLGLHLLNVALLWRLLRKMKLDEVPAAAGCLFFAFHQACFFAYWRPMYVFDVACATFSLLAILAYTANRWIVSLALFWIAYKAKELAVMLPVVLLAWEWWFGEREKGWKRFLRLAPFFAVSASFGIQAILVNRGFNDTYTARWTPAVIWESMRFYSARFLFPYAALGLLALPAVFRRDWRIWLGVVTFWALLTPMLPFPDRRMAVYLYLPLTGAAMVVAALVSYPRLRRPVLGALAVWMVVCVGALIKFEQSELRATADNRTIARALQQFTFNYPEIREYYFESRPEHFKDWGLTGAISIYLRARTGERQEVRARWSGSLDTAQFARKMPVAFMMWDSRARQITLLPRTKGTPDWSYLSLNSVFPLWQLGAGWMPTDEGGFHWMSDRAEVRLYRPREARFFEIVCRGAELVHRFKKAEVRVRMGDEALAPQEIVSGEVQRLRWDLKPGAAGSVPVIVETDRIFTAPPDTRRIALKVMHIGFR
jgi:hypothetical protein